MKPRIIHVAGLPIANQTMEESAEEFVALAKQPRDARGRAFYSTSANGQVIALCESDAGFKADLLLADQIHADGMSLVLFSKKFQQEALSERIATTDLIHAVAAKAVHTGARFYLLGASEEINLAARRALQQAYPGLQIAGGHHGFFDHSQADLVIDDILASKADILWVGFGVPREQSFIRANLHKLQGVAVIKTSGGLFDFLAGKNSRAPQWMQATGLEWLYRLILEPKRLGKRYLLTNPIAAYTMWKKRNG